MNLAEPALPLEGTTPARYAVIGRPIAHSLSPEIHQHFAQQCGQVIDYQRLSCEPAEFAATVQQFFQEGGQGLNVTAPFKTQAFELAQVHDEAARRAGAVNTLLWQGGLLHGRSTDGVGLIRDLRRLGASVSGARIALLGAGGAARSVLSALLEAEPTTLLVLNRSPDKAAALLTGAVPYRGATVLSSCGLDHWPSLGFDLVINATSASLQGVGLVLPPGVFAPRGWAYDMVYGAAPSPFLVQAQQAGAAQLSDGLGMLIEQAAQSYAYWHGRLPDTLPLHRGLRAQIKP